MHKTWLIVIPEPDMINRLEEQKTVFLSYTQAPVFL